MPFENAFETDRNVMDLYGIETLGGQLLGGSS
jgi:hypothetical protein